MTPGLLTVPYFFGKIRMNLASFESLLPEKVPDYLEYSKIKGQLESKKKSLVSPTASAIPGIAPKIVWKYETFLQACLFRVVDLLNLIEISWETKKPIGSYILARNFSENVAQIYDLAAQTDRLCKKGDFKELSDLINGRLFGTKLKEQLDEQFPESVNVLSLIDKIDKKFTGFRINYDRLCEFAHPNYFGMLGHYSLLDQEKIETRFDSEYGMTFDSLGRIFYSIPLEVYQFYLEKLENLLPAVAKLSPDYEELQRL